MTPLSLILIFFAAALVLMFAEMLLPSHGLLGVLAGASVLAGVWVCFRINPRLGVAVLLATVIIAPFVATWMVKLWPRTPLGRRLVLTAVNPTPDPAARGLSPGQHGIAVSALRPMGEVDFGDQRLEAISDYGMIQPGQSVVVVSVANGRPTVRATPVPAQ